jgi:hypothetical protein
MQIGNEEEPFIGPVQRAGAIREQGHIGEDDGAGLGREFGR